MFLFAVLLIIGVAAYFLLNAVAVNIVSLGALLVLGFAAYASLNSLVNRKAYRRRNNRLLEDWFLYTVACSFGLFLGKYWQM